MAGFEQIADAQFEALIKAHTLTVQAFIITASNYIDDTCLIWMEEKLGPQDLVKPGGGWSSAIAPFCNFIAGPHVGIDEKPLHGDIDFWQLGAGGFWIDAAGHDQQAETLQFSFDARRHWADEKLYRFKVQTEEEKWRRSYGALVMH